MKIHLGCGKRNFGEDWIHVDGCYDPDKEEYFHITQNDITLKAFHKDNSVDLIYASHLIAYFDRDEIIPILKEWRRVLKPGGILRLATPDFNVMNDLYSYRKISFKDIAGPLYGKMGMDGQTIYHKTSYDFYELAEVLRFVEFKNIEEYNWRKTEHAQFDDHSQAYLCPKGDKENGILISLNVECTK